MRCVVGMPSASPHGGAEEALMQFCRCREEAGVEIERVIFFEKGARYFCRNFENKVFTKFQSCSFALQTYYADHQ